MRRADDKTTPEDRSVLTFKILTAALVTRKGGGSGDLDKKLAMDSFTGASSFVCRQIS